MTRIRSLTVTLALTLAVGLGGAGCSARKFAYRHGDGLMLRAADEMFALDAAQKTALEAPLAADLAWHKANELPRYVNLLDELTNLLSGDPQTIGRDQLLALFHEGADAFSRLADRLAPDAGPTLAGLTDAQITHAETQLKDALVKQFADLDLPVEEYVRKRLDNDVKGIAEYLGEVTPVQRGLLEKSIREGRDAELARRVRAGDNGRAFIATLRARPGATALTALLHRWMLTGEVVDSPTAGSALAAARERALGMLTTFAHTLTPRQREHARAVIAGLRADFAELIAEK